MKRSIRRRKNNQPISNINVVPYLDVMLVLLVIFMITTPLFNQGLVDLPSVGDAPVSEQKSGAIEVIYEDEGRYRLVNHESGIESEGMDLPALLQALSEESVLRPDGLELVISAEKTLKYGDVMKLLGDLHSGGYAKVGLNVSNDGGR